MLYIVLRLVFSFVFFYVFLARGVNSIGAINLYSNPKTNKKVEIKNEKLRKLVPYRLQHIRIWGEREEYMYSDGTIYKKTVVLTIIFYIAWLVSLISHSLYLILLITCDKIEPLLSMLAFILVAAEIFVGVWRSIEEKKYYKRQERDGMNF